MAKILFALAFLFVASFAFVKAQSIACDPDGNGQPICTNADSNKIYRNNWDPTHYWQCQGTDAVSVECPTQTGFDPKSDTCIPWSEWQWDSICPESS